MIGVAAFPVRQDDRVGLKLTDRFRDSDFKFVGKREAGIGKARLRRTFTPRIFPGVGGSFQARFRSAARSRFAACEIEDAGAIAGL